MTTSRSEEHTSELQSRPHLVCRLLLEKKNALRFSTAHQVTLFFCLFFSMPAINRIYTLSLHDALPISSQTSDTRFNRDVFTEATFTMGDARTALTAIAVHSSVAKQMVKNDDIVYMPDSQGNLTIPTYMGLRVIEDDGLTVAAGTTDGFKYTSVIFGPGAFGYGEGDPLNPVEVYRDPQGGNGGGIETLWERHTWLLHPFGFQQTGTPAGESFTQAELSGAGVWDRILPRKLVPMAFLVTN